MLRQLSLAAFLTRFATMLLCGLMLGCGNDGTQHLSGTVTFQGKPVPAGKIYFLPDSSKNNTGPSGWADIKDGRYDTSAAGGSGVITGPMVVAIEGIDPRPPAGADPSGEITTTVLFPRYETTIDLSSEDVTKDFEVPAEAAKGSPQSQAPVYTGP